MSSFAAELARVLLEKGVALLDRIGQKLPARVRVRTWRELEHDYNAEAKLHDRETRR